MLREFRTQRIIWDTANSRLFDPIQTSGGDQNGRRLEVQILNNGEVEDLTGTDLYLAWQTRNKNHSGLELFDALDASEGIFELYYPTGMLAHAGALRGGLALVDSDGRIVSREFIIQVDRNIVDDEVAESSNEFTALTEALIKVNNLEENYAPQLNSLTAQLAQTATKEELVLKRDKLTPIGLNDADSGLLAAIEGGEGTSFDLKSIPRNYSVSPVKTTFISSSANMFNKKTVVAGVVIAAGQGETTENSSYSVSEFIEVSPSANYSSRRIFRVTFYDESKNYLSHSNNNTSQMAETIIAQSPANAYYMRLSIFNNYIDEAQINEGLSLKPFEDYYEKLTNVTVGSRNLERQSVGHEHLKESSVTRKNLDFVKSSTNLIDVKRFEAGYRMDSDGSLIANDNWYISHFVEIEPLQMYTSNILYNWTGRWFFYDEDENFISSSGVGSTTENQHTVTSPANAKYAKITTIRSYADIAEPMMNKGGTLLPYEDYYITLEGVSISRREEERLSELFNPSDRPMVDVPIEGIFSTTEVYDSEEYASFGNATTSAEVYQLYDNLMAQYPDYITKDVLGNDAWGNPISLYKFKPHRPNASVVTKHPKIFLTSGTHGYEHVPGLVTYLMFKDICENWESHDHLEILRHNVEFLIIPVVNPSGWDDYTRTNRNGVDINRNFPERWDIVDSNPESNTYKGQSPLSELESQYVSSVFDNHPDINIMYDFHNFSGTTTTDFFIWIPTSGGAHIQHLVQTLVSRLTRKWRKEYSFLPTEADWFAGYTDGTSGAMIQDHARARGVKYTATFEVAGRWWMEPNANPYNTTHKVTAVETLVNWLMINLKELIR